MALLGDQAALDPALRLRPGMEGELRESARAMLADPEACILLGFAGARHNPRGAVGLCVSRVERAPKLLEEPLRAQLTELYVREEARRMGLGSALVASALAHARERGVRRIEVRVSARNLAGQGFWRGLGFRDFMDVLDLRL
jgi:ribosomal protein S18 acetylase RimI-like enzyme